MPNTRRRRGLARSSRSALRQGRGAIVSSSRIRAAIAAGRLAEAARLLGRRYAVSGTVVHGDGRGRALGFPTANLAFNARSPCRRTASTPSASAGRTRDAARAPARDGVASLGVRPTFGGGERVLEVHLLDIDEDLYGMRLRVEFVRRQRGRAPVRQRRRARGSDAPGRPTRPIGAGRLATLNVPPEGAGPADPWGFPLRSSNC